MATNPAVFQTWYDASINLSTAVQRYLDASLALEAASTHPFTHTGLDKSTQDKLVTSIHTERPSAEEISHKLKGADLALNRTHNRSIKLVPVHSLPREILTSIFAFACAQRAFVAPQAPTPPNYQKFRTLLTITHICSNWRWIAINTATLWTHVDMIESGYLSSRSKLEELWLTRACHSPLSVQVSIEETVQSPFVVGALDRLRPHLHRVYSLDFQSESTYISPLKSGLLYWLKNGCPGTVQQLSLTGPTSYPGSWDFFGSTLLDSARIYSFLAPLRVLRLHRVSLDWESAAYNGLIRLELSNIPLNECPTFQQMDRILSVCPNLKALKMSTFGIRHVVEEDYSFQPITLEKLEILDVRHMGSDPYLSLFPLIASGPGELSLRTSTNFNQDNTGSALSFFTRLNISKLYISIDPAEHTEAFFLCLASIRAPRALAMDFLMYPSRDFNATLETWLLPPEPDSMRGSRGWGNFHLHTLWLVGGAFSIDCIKHVVVAHSIRKLIFTKVEEPSENELRDEIGPFVEEIIIESDLGQAGIDDWYYRM
ncbi:hypothetical protein FRC10_006388 [Ceratobasidium sp. 414]|nr:hypothetical protein FRC10_006388 [Ceratobasidium sp. 414]